MPILPILVNIGIFLILNIGIRWHYHVNGILKPIFDINLNYKAKIASDQTSPDSQFTCLHCIIPSSDKSVNDIRYSSFSQPNLEKSDSTVAVSRGCRSEPTLD